MKTFIQYTVNEFFHDKTQLLAILRKIQDQYRHIPEEAIQLVAEELDVPIVQVEGVASFYHFFSNKHRGKYTIYLNTSMTAEMAGLSDIQDEFEKQLGIKTGEVTSDNHIGLFKTSCIGMCDQEPAILVNGKVFTKMTRQKVKELVNAMKEDRSLDSLITYFGDGRNSSEVIRSEVKNNIKVRGDVLFSPFTSGESIRKAMELSSLDVIEVVRNSNLRGRGGAGFSTGQKWGFCRSTDADIRYVLCNIDEGEPGTFKDRVLMTELADLVFEGMTVAGYAIEAKEGIVYLRGEYVYLLEHLEKVLEERRKNNLLGKRILGSRFSFDITIKVGAGAYICGEESAMIESAEGKRGQPRNRPPFPVQSGYLHKPTIVNNPETFACAAKIIKNGAEWFKKMGTSASPGKKLFSISGDCERPGVYELEWGKTVREILEICGVKDTLAVNIGGPSGTFVSEKEFGRRVCYSDLATGGAITVFNKSRNLMSLVHNCMDFFSKETCGFCVPCRAGTAIQIKTLEKIMHGRGVQKDISLIEQTGKTMRLTSRCGLGQTASNPLLSTIKHFPEYYKSNIHTETDYLSEFDLTASLAESCEVTHRDLKHEVEHFQNESGES